MKLVTDHLWTRIEGTWPRGILDPVTSYFVDGAWFTASYKKGHWDGYVRFIKYDRSKKQHFFATGFLTRVTQALDKADYPYELFDNRSYDVPEACYELNGVQLDKGKWSFQSGVVATALARGRGILKIPTGGGKTEIAAAIIRSIGKRTLWLTHRSNLMYQTHQRLKTRLQCPVGLIGDGNFKPEEITVGLVQSLSRCLKSNYEKTGDWLRSCEVVVGDELHHLESDQWYDTFAELPAPWRYGLTATPNLDGPGLALLAMTGDIIAEIDPIELMQIGVLAVPQIWFVDVPEPKLPKSMPYQTAYSQGVVDNAARNDLVRNIARTFKEESKPMLVIVRRVRHGEMLADFLTYSGIKTEFCQGGSDSEERTAALKKLADGRLDCIVATNIFDEGQDIPCLKAVINATGGRGGGNAQEGDSGRQTIQILGRGIRAADGKRTFDYVDFADKTHPSLKEASLDRVQTLESLGLAPFIKPWAEYRALCTKEHGL